MKFSRKPLVLLLTLVMAFSVGLSGCKKPAPTPTPEPEAPVVESIVFTNTVDTIGAGTTVIGAKCLPEGSAQEFTAKLDAPAYGVSFSDKTLTVHPGAKKGDTVSITVASTADATKTATKTFTLDIAEPTYTPIKNANELLAILSTEESMSKNYALTDNIILNTTVEDKQVNIDWKASEFAFTGLLDGKGFSIKGLNMLSADENTGFFKENKGVIRNIGFDNTDFPNRWMDLGANSAVIAGRNSGAISNVYTNVPQASKSGTAAALVGSNTGFIENSYAIGATVSNDKTGVKAGVIGENTGSVKGVVADKALTHLDSFYGAKAAQGDAAANAKLLSSDAMQTAKTFTDLGWNAKSWYFTNIYPKLINEAFDIEEFRKSLKILNAPVIEIGDLPAGNVKTIQLQLARTNAIADEIEWSISATTAAAPADTTITSAGVLTLKAPTATAIGGALDGVKVSVLAKIKNADTEAPVIKSEVEFEIRNDGYNTQKGIEISTYDELYDVFFHTSGESADAHNRNITRYIKLKNNIALPALSTAGTNPKVKSNYNWPGVMYFSGVFDGQGYAITGLDVTSGSGKAITVPMGDSEKTFDQNAAFGFFRILGHTGGDLPETDDRNKGGEPGTIRNLTLKDGKISYTGPNEYDRRAIGGLVQTFGSGLIENVLVDLNIHSITNWSGMIVGLMDGVLSVNTASKKGTAILRNSIAMGKITSDGGGRRRADVDPYACGAIVGYTITNGSEIINCYARGEKTDDKNITCRLHDESDGGLFMNSARIENVDFMTAEVLTTKATFDNLGFPDIWSFKDGCYPMLKAGATWTDDDQTIAPSEIEIVSKQEDAYYYPELAAGEKTLQIVAETTNAKGNAVKFSLGTPVTGVSIDEDTGIVSVTSTFAKTDDNGLSVTIKATLGENIASASTVVKIVNSDYVPSKGMAIGTTKELYDTLIDGGFSGKEDNKAQVKRNLTRNIKLTANITLKDGANNWSGVGDSSNKFTGRFDGQGYSIRGLNMTEVSGTYGFFKFIDSKEPNAISIQNLGLEGSMRFNEDPNGNGDKRVGALVGEHGGGIIQNVVVDVDMVAPNAMLFGKFSGYMEGASGGDKAIMRNCVGMGLMEGKQEAFAPGNWQQFTAGAIVGKTEGGNNEIDSCIALIESASVHTGIACRNPKDGGGSKPVNSHYYDIEKFILADTYTAAALPFNDTVWSIKAGCRPMLKNSIDESHKQEVEPTNVMITNSEAFFDYRDIPEKKIAIVSVVKNKPETYTVEYSLQQDVNSAITIDKATGIISVGALTENGVDVPVKVTAKALNGTTVLATSPEYSFVIATDGYSKTTGMEIGTADALYRNLIASGDNATLVGRNMKRKLVLTANITLSGEQAKWPGVENSFSGNFNGQGFTIDGLAVVNTPGSYGFFKRTDANAKDDVIIENLGLGGSITFNNDSDGKRFGALVGEHRGGIIQNVLVSTVITAEKAMIVGKITGYVEGTKAIPAVIRNCVTMGKIIGKTAGVNIAEDAQDRYTAGALVGKVEGGNQNADSPNVIEDCVTLKDAGSGALTGLVTRVKSAAQPINSVYCEVAEFQTVATYTAKHFNTTTTWNITAGQNPALRHA